MDLLERKDENSDRFGNADMRRVWVPRLCQTLNGPIDVQKSGGSLREIFLVGECQSDETCSQDFKYLAAIMLTSYHKYEEA